MKTLNFLSFFLITFSSVIYGQTVPTNKEWVEDGGTITTEIEQINQSTGEADLYRPMIELKYETPTEGGVGGGGGNEPEGFGVEYDYYGIRNNRSTLQIVYGGQNGNYPHVLASFYRSGGLSVEGINSTGGNTFWNLSVFEDDIWTKNVKIGFGSNPLVQQYDFAIGLETQFNRLVHVEDKIWVKPNAKIGIGTSTAPSANDPGLRVDSESQFNELVHVEDRIWVKPNAKVGIGTASAPSGNDPAFRIDSETQFNETVRVTDKLEIGSRSIAPSTKHDDYILSVNGKMVSREVIVTQLNWADYVFEDDYNLRELSEVESFIEENGHLPGMPSQAQVEAEGMSMGEMNRLLLEKIEELTLYIIDLEKRVDE